MEGMAQKYSGNEMVSYSGNGFQLTSDVQNCYIPWNPYNDYFHTHYHASEIVIKTEDKVTKAFKVVEYLMKEKIVKEMKILDFIKLVNKVAEMF